jgi:ABC-type oligopeptide transport system ATPase subunit
MKNKNKAIIFSKDSKPRILVNPNNVQQLKMDSNAIINPDLSMVKNVTVKYWTMKEGKVVEMSQEEKDIVDGKMSNQYSNSNRFLRYDKEVIDSLREDSNILKDTNIKLDKGILKLDKKIIKLDKDIIKLYKKIKDIKIMFSLMLIISISLGQINIIEVLNKLIKEIL